MKKWYGGVLVSSLFMLLVLRYVVLNNPMGQGYLSNPFSSNASNPLEWVRATAPPTIQSPVNKSVVISTETVVLSLFAERNISTEEQQSLLSWHHLRHLIDKAQGLPNGLEAIKQAENAWNSLMLSVEEERLASSNDTSRRRTNEKQCPHFLSRMDATELGNEGFRLRVPCGLTQGSSVTIIGIPDGLLGNFRIDLTGEPLPGEPDPPIILHYNVRLHGDKITEDPVIVQNTWTLAHDWGEEERCPSPSPEKNKKGKE